MTQPQYLAASVRQRLLNLAQSQKENFNLVLTRYGIERLLYRLTHNWLRVLYEFDAKF
jgi:hypothetical protein